MPTYAFTRTLEQIQKLVLRRLRYLDPDESPTATEQAIVNEAIDLRLKELHALGTLWFNVSGATTDLALTSGTATKSLSAVTDFLYAVSVSLRVGTDDQPIEIIGHAQYQAIPNKADQGEPEQVFFSGGTAYFWPTPGSAYTAKLTYHAIAADTLSPAAPDVPVAMMRSLVTLVASDLVDDFGVPELLAQRLLAQAVIAEKTIRILNAERVDNATVEMTSF
jgi:hypothetical protein